MFTSDHHHGADFLHQIPTCCLPGPQQAGKLSQHTLLKPHEKQFKTFKNHCTPTEKPKATEMLNTINLQCTTKSMRKKQLL
jgi:hypothetical protein